MAVGERLPQCEGVWVSVAAAGGLADGTSAPSPEGGGAGGRHQIYFTRCPHTSVSYTHKQNST